MTTNNITVIIADELQCSNNACYRYGQSGLVRETKLADDDHNVHGSVNSLNNVTSEYYVNEELYWSPEHCEDDIKEQLTKLKVENVLKDNVK